MPQVWGYFSVKSGGGIHEFSDSQVGLPYVLLHEVMHHIVTGQYHGIPAA